MSLFLGMGIGFVVGVVVMWGAPKLRRLLFTNLDKIKKDGKT